MSAGDGVGEGLPGGMGRAEVVFPAVVAADGLAGGDVAGAVAGEGLAFGRVELAAVLGQLGRRGSGRWRRGGRVRRRGRRPGPPGPGGGRRGTTDGGAGGGGDGGEDDLGVAGGDLGHLVEHDHRPGGRGGRRRGRSGRWSWRGCRRGGVRRRPGWWRPGRRPGWPAALAAAAAAWTVVVLPNPAGAITRAQGRARRRTALGRRRPGRRRARAPRRRRPGRRSPGSMPGTARCERWSRWSRTRVFEQEVVDGGVPGRAPAGAVDEADGRVGAEEAGARPSMASTVEAAGAEGGDVLDDVGFAEPGAGGRTARPRDRRGRRRRRPTRPAAAARARSGRRRSASRAWPVGHPDLRRLRVCHRPAASRA